MNCGINVSDVVLGGTWVDDEEDEDESIDEDGRRIGVGTSPAVTVSKGGTMLVPCCCCCIMLCFATGSMGCGASILSYSINVQFASVAAADASGTGVCGKLLKIDQSAASKGRYMKEAAAAAAAAVAASVAAGPG